MTEESHAQIQPCPWWCLDRDYEGTPDHPERHEGQLLAVDVAAAGPAPGVLYLQLVQPVAEPLPRVAIARADDEYAGLSGGSARSLAAALTRLADVLEGLAIG